VGRGKGRWFSANLQQPFTCRQPFAALRSEGNTARREQGFPAVAGVAAAEGPAGAAACGRSNNALALSQLRSGDD
jgi:hypothetical protein